jgi:ABC-type sugar transport system permease subunit
MSRVVKANILGYALIAPAILVIIIIGVFPIINTFLYSFQHKILTDPGNDSWVGLQNFITIFKDKSFGNSLKNTILFSVISVIFELLIGFLGALLMHNVKKGRAIIRAAVLIPWAIPGIVIAQMFSFMFNDQLGVINQILRYFGIISENIVWLADKKWAMFAVIIADTWKQFPYVALMLLAGLQIIDDELYESAQIDGASKIRRFIDITLPNIKPILLVVLLFRTMGAIRIFDIIYGMTGGGPADSTNTLLNASYKYLFSDYNFGMGSAMSVIIFLIILVFSACYLKILKSDDEEEGL